MEAMAKGAGSDVGTGGMAAKVSAARIANDAGADMVIANGADMNNLRRVVEGQQIGTLFKAHRNADFHLINYLMKDRTE